jgi:glycosyltransferase involved in cell wall biosynthesis
MHIGVLTHNYPRFAGDFSGTFIEALCREYARQGHRVTVWAPDDVAYSRASYGPVDVRRYRYAAPASAQRLGYMRSMQSDLSLRLNSFALSPLLFASGIARLYWDALRQKPDVLHAHWILPNGFIAAVVSRLLGIPLVVSVPGSDAQVAGQNALFRAMAKFVFEQASLLTANSSELRDAVISLGADPDKFDLVLYGVDPDALRPDRAASADLRLQWASRMKRDASEATFVLAVGRMVPKKGFDVLLRALAEPMLQRRNLCAVLVGDGDERLAWQRLAVELGVADRVHWAGTVSKNDIGRYYNAADLLVMPSVSKPADGLNVCVLDAMSCGLPVVASSVAGNSLAVGHGDTGLIVPEQEPAVLASALALLADNPALREVYGAAGRRRIDLELGWPSIAKRYMEQFRRLSSFAASEARSDPG